VVCHQEIGVPASRSYLLQLIIVVVMVSCLVKSQFISAFAGSSYIEQGSTTNDWPQIKQTARLYKAVGQQIVLNPQPFYIHPSTVEHHKINNYIDALASHHTKAVDSESVGVGTAPWIWSWGLEVVLKYLMPKMLAALIYSLILAILAWIALNLIVNYQLKGVDFMPAFERGDF